jgi:hypothetical protein
MIYPRKSPREAGWIACLVGFWLLLDYPAGLLLFCLGGCAHWSLNRAKEVSGRYRSSLVPKV